MKYLILFVLALCPWLLISGAFGAILAVFLFAMVLLYLCQTKGGKTVKTGLARMLIKLEKLFNE